MTDPDPDPLVPFGPFTPHCSDHERVFLFGLLCGLVHALCGGSSPAADALYRARSCRLDDAAVALAELGRLTPVQKRRVLGSYLARVGHKRVIANPRGGSASPGDARKPGKRKETAA